MKAHEFDRVIQKFEMTTREGRDRLAWFEYEGKVITRTRRSRGSGDLPFQHHIRQQLKLSDKQLRDAVSCKFARDGYIEILRQKGLLD